jgi:hypothetical protein
MFEKQKQNPNKPQKSFGEKSKNVALTALAISSMNVGINVQKVEAAPTNQAIEQEVASKLEKLADIHPEAIPTEVARKYSGVKAFTVSLTERTGLKNTEEIISFGKNTVQTNNFKNFAPDMFILNTKELTLNGSSYNSYRLVPDTDQYRTGDLTEQDFRYPNGREHGPLIERRNGHIEFRADSHDFKLIPDKDWHRNIDHIRSDYVKPAFPGHVFVTVNYYKASSDRYLKNGIFEVEYRTLDGPDNLVLEKGSSIPPQVNEVRGGTIILADLSVLKGRTIKFTNCTIMLSHEKLIERVVNGKVVSTYDQIKKQIILNNSNLVVNTEFSDQRDTSLFVSKTLIDTKVAYKKYLEEHGVLAKSSQPQTATASTTETPVNDSSDHIIGHVEGREMNGFRVTERSMTSEEASHYSNVLSGLDARIIEGSKITLFIDSPVLATKHVMLGVYTREANASNPNRQWLKVHETTNFTQRAIDLEVLHPTQSGTQTQFKFALYTDEANPKLIPLKKLEEQIVQFNQD